MIVVDASVALKWFVPEPGSEQAERLLEFDLPRAAPAHVLVEVGQALLRHHRSGGLTADHCRLVMSKIRDVVRLFPTEMLADAAFQIAAEASCSMYDALYVAAAERWDCWLVTADAKLRTQLLGSLWQHAVWLLGADTDERRLMDTPSRAAR
ncbi:type II toxin-antitoxin system VapC family toxin [uncultured Enterovirga sp.]|uniref:type II toxin-antitoxin system VapC family toxin n=1 Tax=uncultured Enterovirga sp. TaxID=2026352 RepID=UPI0035CC7418